MAALSEVFGTVELFENILYQLPTRDLLLAQRVSKEWQTVITSSIKLQRALFLVPVEGGPLEFHRGESTDGNFWTLNGTQTVSEQPFKNPLLTPLFKLFRDSYLRPWKRWTPELSWKWQDPEASWRRMLATQPTITVVFCIRNRRSHDVGLSYGTGDQSIGVIFDQLETDWKHSSSGLKNRHVECDGIAHCRELRSNDELEGIAA